MTAKEFLQRFLNLQREADSCMAQIEQLQSMAKNMTTVIRDVPTGGTRDVSRVENSVVDIHQHMEKLADLTAQALAARNEIAEAIAEVKNHDERYLLEQRYIGLESWEKIAAKMHFSLQGIFKLHSRALKNFSFEQSV